MALIQMAFTGLVCLKAKQIEGNDRFQYPWIDGASQAISKTPGKCFCLIPSSWPIVNNHIYPLICEIASPVLLLPYNLICSDHSYPEAFHVRRRELWHKVRDQRPPRIANVTISKIVCLLRAVREGRH